MMLLKYYKEKVDTNNNISGGPLLSKAYNPQYQAMLRNSLSTYSNTDDVYSIFVTRPIKEIFI